MVKKRREGGVYRRLFFCVGWKTGLDQFFFNLFSLLVLPSVPSVGLNSIRKERVEGGN